MCDGHRRGRPLISNKDINLITPPSAATALSTALATNPFLTKLPGPKPDVLAPEALDFNTGTAEILRLPEVKSVITSDFIVLPCDLVCELRGDRLLQAWMVKSASLADLLGEARPGRPHSGGLGVWYETKSEAPIKGQETDFLATVPIPQAKAKAPTPKDSVLPHVEKVVLSMPTNALNDVVDEKNGLPIRHSLIRKHPRIRLLTSHRDAHIYVFPRWVMDFAEHNPRFDSIGEDVLGWWAKATWQRGLADKLGMGNICADRGAKDTKSSEPDDSESPLTGSPGPLPTKASTPNTQAAVSLCDKKDAEDPIDAMQPRSSSDTAVPPMLAYIHPAGPAPAPLIRRVDNAQLLLATSLQLAKLPSVEEAGGPEAASPFAHARKVAYPEGVRPRTTITRPDSLLADNVTVQERAAIRESVVGAHCHVGEGARLTQCLLMDGAVVGRNCRLTRCVLGRRCEIGEGCVLAECEVQENLLVEPRTEAKNEKLMSSSGLEATEEEMQEALEQEGMEHEEAVLD